MNSSFRRNVAALAVGVLFGFGLALSQMVNPVRVLGFLDVFGAWDPTLLFVMGGAVAVTLVAFRFVLKLPRPLLDDRFHTPATTTVDRELVLGALLFGLGWGTAGYCPGPALAGLAYGLPEQFLFVAAMLAGGLAQRHLRGPFLSPRSA